MQLSHPLWSLLFRLGGGLCQNGKLRPSSRLEGACDRNGEIFFTSPPGIEISPLASLGRNDSRLHSLRSVENDSRLHSLRSVAMTTGPIRSASVGITVVCVIPSAVEESPEQKPQPREIPPLRALVGMTGLLRATRSGRNDRAFALRPRVGMRRFLCASHSGGNNKPIFA